LLVPRSSSTPVAAWAWPTWVVSRRRVLEAVFVLLESPSPSRRIFIGSHSLLPPFLVRRIGPSVTREEHGHWRRGSTAVAARWWRVESGAGAVEREREREREKERERVGRGERWIWESNRAVKGRSTS
jgi:hypothetical protein